MVTDIARARGATGRGATRRAVTAEAGPGGGPEGDLLDVTAEENEAVEDLDGLGDIDDTPRLPEEDDPVAPDAQRRDLLRAARRRLVPVRRTFVQALRGQANRAGPLARLVAERQHVALDLLLLLIALQPVIGPNDPIAGRTWARLLSGRSTRSPATVSRTWKVLADLGLVEWTPNKPVVLLREDGSGQPYTHPGEGRVGAGYFGLPRRYWLDGWHERLRLPGKAMLLVLLAETNNPATPSFSVSAERIAEYYGFSVATVKRGLAELREAGLLGESWRKVGAPRSPTGWTYHVHYWLKNPFSTAYREAARVADATEADRRRSGRTASEGDLKEVTDGRRRGRRLG